ncbi:mesoderm posterior ba [Trichomycterus rosablanca]|uniref:mesoderm posterior ba n=1 Tax=Trichomycterus rosablanca TaxID=2290929 RepID=UPI002F352A74
MDASGLVQHSQTQWSSPSSDSELYSISSPETVSPAPSVDLNASLQFTKLSKVAAKLTKAADSSQTLGRRTRRSRLKNPSEQRQNASEKEKLRMRDLTKALHHLRTYLPPTVAPVGQTLTKIETLRLTIRYISYLSAQLGLSEEHLSQRKLMSGEEQWREAPEILGYFQCTSASRQWPQGQRYSNYAGHDQTGSGMEYTEQRSDVSQNRTQVLQNDQMMDQIYSSDTSSFQSSFQTQSCQVYGYQLVPQAFWS